MPIDPSVFGAYRQPLRPVSSPADIAAQRRQEQMQQIALARQQSVMAQEQAAQQREQAIQSVVQKHGGNLEAAAGELSALDPQLGRQLYSAITSRRQDERIAQEKTAAQGREAQKMFDVGLWQAVNDAPEEQKQATFDAIVNEGKANGIKDLPGGLAALKPRASRYFADDIAKAQLLPKEQKPIGTREIQTIGADGNPVIRIVPDVPGEFPAAPPKGKEVTVGSLEDYLSATPERRREIERAKRAMAAAERAPERAGEEPLVPIIGPDGQAVLVRRSAAEGQRPANAREQGRPVTSGDAGRIADFDTSLNDLRTLGQTIPKGSTGTSAAFGASLPNFVTQATGVGVTAKQKQAVIDRVKQVIGKTLEGGVLRKEDEAKYEKILPTIGDVDSVVEAKLKGLEQAIRTRRQTTLDALSDAGYDTTKYTERGKQSDAMPKPTHRFNPETGQIEAVR